jgi:hypothetical protein
MPRMGERPAIEQVKSGFQIAAAILIYALAICSFVVGYNDVTQPERHQVALGWTLLVLTSFAMFFTFRFWVKWFCGIACYVALRSTLLLLRVHQAKMQFSPAIEFIVGFFITAGLTIRLYGKREFSKFDRVAITAAAVCLLWAFVRFGKVAEGSSCVPILFGIAFLLAALVVETRVLPERKSEIS